MRIEDALTQVRLMQVQVARIERFSCYRSATVGASGVLGLGAALVQPYWVAEPTQQLPRYLSLWVLVAVVSVTFIGVELLARWWRTESAHARRQTVLAVRQFTPCLVAGALLTWAIVLYSPASAFLLPALWSVVFSLGVFASSQHLPAASTALAAYYLVTGLACIGWGRGEQALQPWTMALTFGVGQLLAAFVLHHPQEGHDVETSAIDR
jgi:hypothetical protein